MSKTTLAPIIDLAERQREKFVRKLVCLISLFTLATIPVYAEKKSNLIKADTPASTASIDWLKNGVIYQIFPDRFCNGDNANDVQTNSYIHAGKPTVRREWTESPKGKAGEDQGQIFFGGDLAGIRKKLTYIRKEVGANIIYLTPVFKAPSNHKYDTADYDVVDPAFGTNLDLSALSAQIHKSQNGKVGHLILDGVFNHTGDSHKWFGKYEAAPGQLGAFQSQQSPYSEFYTFSAWPDKYACFMTFDSLPKLNFGSDEVRRRIFTTPDSVAQRYLKAPYNIDGWRLDAPKHADANGGNGENEFNHALWRDFRRSIKDVNSKAAIIGEYWGNARDWTAAGDQWDGATNFEGFTQPVSQWITGKTFTGEPAPFTVSQFDRQLKLTRDEYPVAVQQSMSNHLSNHDIPRFAERADGEIRKTILAHIFQMTYIGVPTIYYGDEYGMTGGADPDNRKPMDWSKARANNPSISMCRKLIAIRKKFPALRTGSFTTIKTDDTSNIYCYARSNNTEKVLVVLNNDSCEKLAEVPLSGLDLTDGTVAQDELSHHRYTIRAQKITVTVPAYFGAIFVFH